MIIYTIVKLKLNKTYDAAQLYHILINRKAKEDILSFFTRYQIFFFVFVAVCKYLGGKIGTSNILS